MSFVYMILFLILLSYYLFKVELALLLIVRCSALGEYVQAFSKTCDANLKFNLTFKFKLSLTM